MLRSDLCDCNDAYVIVKGVITVQGTNTNNQPHKNLAFKNNDPFRLCISKLHSTVIDNTVDLDIVMPIYNLLEYSKNYSMTSESL